jgi:hypothetical protein
MGSDNTRRALLKQSVAAIALTAVRPGAPAVGAEVVKRHFICVTCGIQFAATEGPPGNCPVCDDERQYVGHGGQQWTTLDDYRKTHRNVIAEEAGLYSIRPTPKAGIGQRAFLVRTAEGNLLWDCVGPLDDATVEAVRKLGGLAGIAVSHPHYYTTMVEWSHAFGKVPIHLHKNDAKWVMRPDDVIQFWEGATKPLFGGLTLVNTGGHFDGYQVLHWPDGAGGKGVLLCGDQPFVCQDRRWVSFMYSYPNFIPLGAGAIRQVVERLKPFAYDQIQGAFVGQVVAADAKGVVGRSAERYLKMIGG